MLRLGPNPFHGSTAIVFSLPKDGPVDLRILDLAGRVVRTLASRSPTVSGLHALSWDGRRDDGDLAPAGVYFVRLKTPDRETRGRLTKL